MEQTTIAKPYANAILEVAAQDNSYSAWHELLSTLAQIGADELYQAFDASPQVSKQEKIDTTVKLLGSALGRDLGAPEQATVALLQENARMGVVADILALFEEAMNASNDTRAFQVISAYKLTQAEEKQITQDLAAKYNASVSIETQVDETLTGGVVIREGDKVLDLSIQARVAELQTRLSAN